MWLWQTRSATAALCFQGTYKMLLTSSVLIHSDIHWSQPGEKRMTGGTNWQPKAAPTTTWNPVSMVTHTWFLLYSCLILLPNNHGPCNVVLLCAYLLFVFKIICVINPYMYCPVCVPSATINHGLPCHHTDRHDGIWHGQYSGKYTVCVHQVVCKKGLCIVALNL